MIPFRLTFEPGKSLYEQVVYAVKKAIVSGQLAEGEAFPSVRTLSSELKINPNTAHKVVTHLIAEGHLEARPGIGTVVTKRAESTAAERAQLIDKELEQVVVEARRLGLTLDDLNGALGQHWKRLNGGKKR